MPIDAAARAGWPRAPIDAAARAGWPTAPVDTIARPGAPEPGSALVRRARLVALAVGAFLLPWCVVLRVALPAVTLAQNWSLAWMGLDAAEAVAAVATGVLLARRSPRASLTAAAGAALLLIDAWFDVCTSASGPQRMLAGAEAIFVELPLAAAAVWLAVALTRRPASRRDTGRDAGEVR